MYLNEHLKRKAEIEDKKKELEVTTQQITDQETVVVTATPTAMPHYANVDGSMSITIGDNGLLPELCITFHLHYISFALHLKILPRQHEMHATSQFKCHALHLHFMK